MYPDTLAFGIVSAAPRSGDPELALKLRELTVAWSRYDYRGRILEAATIERILDEALDLGYTWCLVQAAGHVILERWDVTGMHERFDEFVMRCISERDFLALGAVIGDNERGYGLDDQCLLVDLRRYRDLGQPPFGSADGAPAARHRTASVAGWNFVDVSLRNGLAVNDIGPILDERCLSLGRLSASETRRFARYVGSGVRSYDEEEVWLDPRTGVFLTEVQRQVANARRGVFLWNLESYEDVRIAPFGFEPPISTLYSVASGFKPNMILESLGFDQHTRVVFFDYSAKALEAKRLVLDQWDGRDFPAFARHLFRRLPSPDAYYHLWSGATPETVDWTTMEQAWAHELEEWGGERAFEEHWSRYRRLRHEFVHCDVLSSSSALLGRIEPEHDAVIWWSNAFFSVYGNWLYTADERRRCYDEWVEALAQRNPDLFLYGSDFCNSSVNDIQAGEYRTRLRHAVHDELIPLSANVCEIRF